jgi:hypothetical protein
MIKQLLINPLELIWILFHVALGVVSTFTPYPFIFWMYAVLGTSFLGLLLNRNRDGIMTMVLAYLVGTEVFSRMMRAPLTGIYPDEVGKYFPLFVLITAFLIEGKMRSKSIGWWIIILTLPSTLYIESWNLRYGIVFNYLGILNLALLIIYFSEKKIGLAGLNNLFKLILYPLISVAVFLFIKTPDFDEISWSLSSNFTATGGYGPNQVSTALGIGVFIMLYFYLTKQRVFALKYLDEFLLGIFLFRGLLTFSRGGVIVPIFCILLFYMVIRKAKDLRIQGNIIRKVNFVRLSVLTVAAAVVFVLADSVTGGSLLMRYQGQTAGTVAGTQEIDLDHYSSNRITLMKADLALWLQNPYFGVGPGMSKYQQGDHYGVGTHTEATRLLAEHGILGGIVLLILAIYPISYYRKLKHPLHRALFVSFISFAILTSFHAAMRTMVTPFFFGLAFANFNFK